MQSAAAAMLLDLAPEAASGGLTTVDGLSAEKGRAAARLVLEPGPVRRVPLPTGLILHDSAAPAPARTGTRIPPCGRLGLRFE